MPERIKSVERRRPTMTKRFPVHPARPELICWGCDKYCPAKSMACGNGSERTQHPYELFGDDWQEWDRGDPTAAAYCSPAREQ
jgi:hypothetical protein